MSAKNLAKEAFCQYPTNFLLIGISVAKPHFLVLLIVDFLRSCIKEDF